jgi:hypothetical protein
LTDQLKLNVDEQREEMLQAADQARHSQHQLAEMNERLQKTQAELEKERTQSKLSQQGFQDQLREIKQQLVRYVISFLPLLLVNLMSNLILQI